MRTDPAVVGPAARATAWLGGALFVFSLAFFVWSYAVRFGRSAPSGGAGDVPAALAVNAFLFTAFALHHSVMARSRAKAWLTRAVPPALERSVYVWIASAMFIVTCAAWREIPVVLYDVPWPAKGACLALQGWGVWLTLRSAGVIDPLELAGIRQVLGRARPPSFKVFGPYHLVRHPIYFGWALMTLTAPLMTGTRLSFAVISTAYLMIAIPFEERSLIDVFGDEYRAYQARVRWRMLPGVY
jgi:protein-S-isoprenylcysteine O-methyltransferase Ste14